MSLNLGGLYAEELCFRSKIDKTKKVPSDSDIKVLYNELQKLYSEKANPNLLEENPVPIKLNSLGLGKEFASYNEALDSYYSNFIKEEEEKEKIDPKLNKYKEILKDQESQYQEIELSIQDNRFKGEYIYNNYMELKEILETFKTDRKSLPKTIKIENKIIQLEIK